MGSIYGHIQAISGRNTHNIELYYSVEQDIAKNYSIIYTDLYYYNDNLSSIATTARGAKVWVNGEYFKLGDIRLSGGANYRIKLGSFQKRVEHKDDGTAIAELWASVPIRATINGNYYEKIETKTQSITLPKIPRNSTLATIEGSRELGSLNTLTLRRAKGSFTHRVRYRLRGSAGESTWYDLGYNHATSVEFTPVDKSELEPNSSTIYADFIISTYEGTEKIGNDLTSAGWTFKVPTKYQPSISISNINEAWTKVHTSLGAFARGLTSLEIGTLYNGVKDSTIKSCKLEVDGKSYDVKNGTLVTSTLYSVGDIPVKATVVDSRGRKASTIKVVRVHDYSPPKINRLIATRCDASGLDDAEGGHAKLNFDVVIADTNGRNRLNYTIKYRDITAEKYITIYAGASKSINTSYITGDIFDRDKSYIVSLECNDYFYKAVSANLITETFSLIDFHRSGKGLAIGKISSDANVFEVNLPTKFKKPVTFFTDLPREVEVALFNEWSVFGDATPRVYKDALGTVHLRGHITIGSASKWQTFARIPVGYRPTSTVIAIAGVIHQGSNTISIYSNGAMSCEDTPVIGAVMSLDGISFYVGG